MDIPSTQQLLDKRNIFAVVGASNDKDKYGYKVYQALKKNGYTVYPVNPNRDTIQGDPAFDSLQDLPQTPDVVSVITPPEVSREILNTAISLNIKNIWFQPGAEDQYIINVAAKSTTINIIHSQCLLVALGEYDNESPVNSNQ